jgi:hypothetical protein
MAAGPFVIPGLTRYLWLLLAWTPDQVRGDKKLNQVRGDKKLNQVRGDKKLNQVWGVTGSIKLGVTTNWIKFGETKTVLVWARAIEPSAIHG